MDLTSILPYLQARKISFSHIVYCTTSVSVYKAQWQNCVSAVKILSLEPGDDYQRMERECHAMMRLQHPNIVKMYDCFWCSDSQKHYLVIVVEWCNKDVMKDIHERRNAQFPWAEDKLWHVIRGLVAALAYMQVEGFAHRDIKPQNLFIVDENLIKIGDFGSGRFADSVHSDGKMTLIGTPFFLSPLLKQNFLENRGGAVHNAFKSDAYSLGLTLLLMVSESNQNTLASTITHSNSLWTTINILSYSDSMKSMLWWMLQHDEKNRCDFLQLSQWLEWTRKGDIPVARIAEESLICMKCGGQIGSIHQEVTLECDPTHQFCSQQCFIAFLRECAPACPRCFAPIFSSFRQRVTNSVIDFEYSLDRVSQMNCLFCRSPIDVRGLDIEQKIVRLSCEPRKHVFCTTRCFDSYKRIGNNKCPICLVVLSQDLSSQIASNQTSLSAKARIEEGESWFMRFALCCGPRRR